MSLAILTTKKRLKVETVGRTKHSLEGVKVGQAAMLLVFLWYCGEKTCSAAPGAVAVLELQWGKGLSLRNWEQAKSKIQQDPENSNTAGEVELLSRCASAENGL